MKRGGVRGACTLCLVDHACWATVFAVFIFIYFFVFFCFFVGPDCGGTLLWCYLLQYHVGMGTALPNATDGIEFDWARGITYESFSPLCGPCDGSDKYELINGTLVTSIGKKYNKTGFVECAHRVHGAAGFFFWVHVVLITCFLALLMHVFVVIQCLRLGFEIVLRWHSSGRCRKASPSFRRPVTLLTWPKMQTCFPGYEIRLELLSKHAQLLCNAQTMGAFDISHTASSALVTSRSVCGSPRAIYFSSVDALVRRHGHSHQSRQAPGGRRWPQQRRL